MSVRAQVAHGPGEERTGGADELLHQGERVRLVRRHLAAPGPGSGPVLCRQFLGAGAAERAAFERDVLERLAGVPGVPRLLTGSRDGAALVLDEQRGDLLAHVLRAGPVSVPVAMEWALDLARTLDGLHRRGVTHGDVTPRAVLVGGSSRRPVLVDFGRATTVAERLGDYGPHEDLEGSLPYLAPEQTGRTGRPIDQRSDLYMLGVTLYEMVTGRHPFEATDTLRLLRDVLLRPPVPPEDLTPGVPGALSVVIQRLLEKEPDRRYQSAEGLAHDLARVLREQAAGAGRTFVLGEQDFPLRLAPPSRLVGRGAETAVLARAMDECLTGRRLGVLVGGPPGVGKTALVDGLRSVVTAHHGWFLSGTFDQFRRDRTSDAVQQALRLAGRLLLTKDDADLAAHRASLLEAVGPNVGLLVSTQPELGLVFSTPPEDVTGEPPALEGRLVQAQTDLLRTLARPDRPVVLVLDDLQWATRASLSLLDALLTDPGTEGLLVVGVYRDTEVDVTHPLSPLLARWERLERPPLMLRPSNLHREDLALMLGEMLRLPPQQAGPLADVVGERSSGNPFDTVELVNVLRRDGVLVRRDGGWHWDPATIRRHIGDGDVVELLAGRIDALPADTGALLACLACLGGRVGLGLLHAAGDLDASALAERLLPALEDGLLVVEQRAAGAPRHSGGTGERAWGVSGTALGDSDEVRFRHDRVQQAALARLSPDSLTALRLGIARNLATRPDLSVLAAEQYLPVARSLEAGERRRVIELFRGAARAGRLVNPAATERFLAAALELLGPPEEVRAPEDRRLLLGLETDHHRALYGLGRFDQLDRAYQAMRRHHRDPLELAEASGTQVSSLTVRNRPADAVALGLDVLRCLGVAVPGREELPTRIDRGMERLRQWVAEGDVAQDLGREAMQDPTAMAAARIMNRMIPPAFFVGSPLTPWLVFECQRLWAEHGPCAALTGPLAHAAFVSLGLGQHHRIGYDAVRRVLAVSEARGEEPDTSQARILLALSASHWFEPLERVLEDAQRGHEGAVHGGDLQNAGFGYFGLVPPRLECAPTLDDFLTHVEAALEFTGRMGNDVTRDALVGYRQLARALQGETARPGSLADESFDPVRHLARSHGQDVVVAYTHITLGLAALLFGDDRALAEHSLAALGCIHAFEATPSTVLARLLRGVALARSLAAASPVHGPEAGEERALTLAELDALREWLGARAQDAPVNYAHLALLLDAERAWALGDAAAATLAFDRALLAVEDQQRPWHAALLAERAGRFHLSLGHRHLGAQLLETARARYEAWGATAKVAELEEGYPELRRARRSRPGPGPGGQAGETPLRSGTIDLLAVLRASQVLSSETNRVRLQERVSGVLGAMTGARAVRTVLWREDPGEWLLSAQEDGEEVLVPLGEAEERRLLPMSAVRYVTRTREPLLVEDTERDSRVENDPYTAAEGCRSLMVVPILSQGAPRAVLVLESGIPGAFSPERLVAVELLAGQLAVSLDNALGYEELERRVGERTRELREAQGELVRTARRVGMAEISTNVLHSVGNVLSALNLSAGLVTSRLHSSKVGGLARAVALIEEHRGELGRFLTDDERGSLLPGYLAQLSSVLTDEHRAVVEEMGQLTRSIGHIKEIVTTQQSYAGRASLVELVGVADLVDDALRMNAEALERHGVRVFREYAELPPMMLDKARVVLILVNLIANAKNALDDVDAGRRSLTLGFGVENDLLQIRVADTGRGIPPQDLTRVFIHGFTTREDGHGFGLHSCALAAIDMGGTLTVDSEGSGRGAVFSLVLPVVTETGAS